MGGQLQQVKMDYMPNTNFIATLIERQGVSQSFEKSDLTLMMVHIENQAKMLIEIAIKYMRKDGRKQLRADDVEMAVQELRLGHMLPVAPMPMNRKKKRKLEVEDLDDFEKESLGYKIKEMNIKGDYLYRDGQLNKYFDKILHLKDHQVNCFSLERRPCEGQFNIILSQEDALFTVEEESLIDLIKHRLSENRVTEMPILAGNIQKIFPILVSLARRYPNQAGLILLRDLLNHNKIKYSTLILELHHFLQVFLVYRGFWSYQVGQIIAKLVERFIKEQPDLLRVMERIGIEYSHVLKAIAFEEYLGVCAFSFHLQIFFEKIVRDSMDGKKLACFCLKTFMEKVRDLPSLIHQDVICPLWMPNQIMNEDPYLQII